MNSETLVLQIEQWTDDGTMVGMLFCPSPGIFTVDVKLHDGDKEHVEVDERCTGPRQAMERMMAKFTSGEDLHIVVGQSPFVAALYPVMEGMPGDEVEVVRRMVKASASTGRTLNAELPSMAGAL